MGQNFQGLLDDVIQPNLMETVYVTELQPMLDLFNSDPFKTGGSNIVKNIITSEESNADNYDRSDVNPAPDSFSSAQASWARDYTHVAFDVHGIDKSEASNGGIKEINDLIAYKSAKAFKQLRKKIFANLMTQLKADIDDTGAFSDNALSRSTYPTLASTVNDTDTTITLAIMRALKFSTTLNKNVDKMDYIWLIEPTVNKVVQELLGAANTWNINDPTRDGKFAGGYQEAASFDSNRILEMMGMTVGDMFFINPDDIYIDSHRALHIEQVASGKDSAEFVMRIGMNLWTDHPGHQAKATDKD